MPPGPGFPFQVLIPLRCIPGFPLQSLTHTAIARNQDSTDFITHVFYINTIIMNTTEVADKLVELCRQGKIDEAQQTLYAANVKSIEASDMMGPKVVEGMDAVKAKSAAFQASVEAFHGQTISEPIVAGNSFAIAWSMDVTFKGRGRMNMDEICVYQVQDGKVVLEQFFY